SRQLLPVSRCLHVSPGHWPAGPSPPPHSRFRWGATAPPGGLVPWTPVQSPQPVSRAPFLHGRSPCDQRARAAVAPHALPAPASTPLLEGRHTLAAGSIAEVLPGPLPPRGRRPRGPRIEGPPAHRLAEPGLLPGRGVRPPRR